MLNCYVNFSSAKQIFLYILKRRIFQASGVKYLITNNICNFGIRINQLHTSHYCCEIKSLNEFFDEKDNWGVSEVKVGRSWKIEELRLKSNQDLHKLWYVLLKERNMLMTMEQACKDEFKLFPNPERIDKVNDSMKNLESVVRERNRAYMLLETGETGERPSGEVVDSFGRYQHRRFSEHAIPDYMNTRIFRRPTHILPWKTTFNRLLREKREATYKGYLMRKGVEVAKIISEYPDTDIEALKIKYPEIDVEKVRRSKQARGNHSKNVV